MATHFDKYRNLVETLFIRTSQKTLDWSIDDFTSNVTCRLGNFSVSISETESSEGSPIISIRLLSIHDELVDQFSDEDISSVAPSISEYSTYWGLMVQLYRTAKRIASGADAALDSVLKFLEEDDRI